MARIERVTRVCDLPHDRDVRGARAVFVLAERIYTIDACQAHKAQLRAAVALITCAITAYQANAHKRQGTRYRPRQTLRQGR